MGVVIKGSGQVRWGSAGSSLPVKVVICWVPPVAEVLVKVTAARCMCPFRVKQAARCLSPNHSDMKQNLAGQQLRPTIYC